jgi:hypothetical protein
MFDLSAKMLFFIWNICYIGIKNSKQKTNNPILTIKTFFTHEQ